MTAVQWGAEQQKQLFNSLKNGEIQIDEYEYYLNLIIEGVLIKEKIQIMDAYKFGVQDEYVVGAENYYLKQL